MDTYLVEGVRHGLRVVTGARVRTLEPLPHGVVLHAAVGRAGHDCTITARIVVVAAGAIASSALLARSRLGGRNVGTRLSYNLSFPVLARMPDPVRAHAEVPMSAYVDHGTHILESIFFPPAAFAALLPEWGSTHRESMEAYDHFAGAAVLTASRPVGRVVATHRSPTHCPASSRGSGTPTGPRPRTS